MKSLLVLAGTGLVLAVFMTGCETDRGVAGRIQEKSAVYATLKPWQKKHIEHGNVVIGFTTDMVYMAVGNPSSKKTAGEEELWEYRNFYPPTDANFKYNLYNEAPMQGSNLQAGVLMSGNIPVAGMRSGPSSFTTGGPQGGSMEPAAPDAYTLKILFRAGTVVNLGLVPN